MNAILTKSKYLLGLECSRYFWTVFNHPEKIRKASLADEFKFKEGTKAGELAKTLFPDGINLPTKDFKENLAKTKESLNKGLPLFEAGFLFNNCFSRADILVPIGKEWDIIEVKSGTEVKDINVHDVSFQKYVYENNGLKIRKCFLMHLNKEYFRKGELNVNELFVKEDITSEVNKTIEGIKERINEMFKVISSKEPPKSAVFMNKIVKDGHHDCFAENCVELPDNHVFCLYRGGKLSCELFENGIENIKDIPEDAKLSDKQKIQRECEISGKVHADKTKIKQFLKKLKYPLYYLDFETFSTAIPMFDGLKPYSQVPFQFSLHIAKKEGDKPEHHAFLYNGNSDPRKEFLSALKKLIENKGSIVVYNQSFEIGRLKELAEHLPEHKRWINYVLKRIVDLLIPFREFSYYNPKQQGSASIKDVLPAIAGKSYKGMEIGDGGTASVEFFRTTYEQCPEQEKQKIRDNLLKYCELDTLAEVMIIEKLELIAKKERVREQVSISRFENILEIFSKDWFENNNNKDHIIFKINKKLSNKSDKNVDSFSYLKNIDELLQILKKENLISKNIKTKLKNAPQFEDTLSEIKVASYIICKGIKNLKLNRTFPDIELVDQDVVIEVKRLHSSRKLLKSDGKVICLDDITRIWSKISEEILTKLDKNRVNLILFDVPVGVDFDEFVDLFVLSQETTINLETKRIIPSFKGEFSKETNKDISGVIMLKNDCFKGLNNPLNNKIIPDIINKIFNFIKVIVK